MKFFMTGQAEGDLLKQVRLYICKKKNDFSVTCATSIAAVCAATLLPFLAFLNPTVP